MDWTAYARSRHADYLREGVALHLRTRRALAHPADRRREWREAMRYARMLRQYGEPIQ